MDVERIKKDKSFQDANNNFSAKLGIVLTFIVLSVPDKEIAAILELPPIKLHCSVLAEAAIKQAIVDWDDKRMRRHNGGPDDRDN